MWNIDLKMKPSLIPPYMNLGKFPVNKRKITNWELDWLLTQKQTDWTRLVPRWDKWYIVQRTGKKHLLCQNKITDKSITNLFNIV